MKFKDYLRLLFIPAKPQEHPEADLSFHVREMAFLIPHAKKYGVRYLGLFVFLLLSAVLSLPGPAITGVIIDKVFVLRDSTKLNAYVIILLGLLVVSEIVRIGQDYSILKLSQEFTFSIRVQLIERILRYPLSFFKQFKTGYLLARLDEVNLLGSFFSVTVLSLGENVIRFVGAILLIHRYNRRMTVISLLVLPLFFEVARRSVKTIRSTSLGAMEKSAKVRGAIQETLSGIEVVKSYAREDGEAAKIKKGLRSLVDLEIIQNLFGSLSGKALGILTSLNLLLILWVGGREIIAGRLTVGQYVAFVSYVGYLYLPIQMFALTILQFQRAFVACKRISAFHNETSEAERYGRTHEFHRLRGRIEFDNVSYHYENGSDVLHNITFSIREGEKVAFVGKSGAGKTTLVHLSLGLFEPTSGRIEIDGIDLRTVVLKSLRNRIGIVSQNIFLFDDSILNNIKYSHPDATMAEVVAAAQAASCHDFISQYSEGYHTNAGEIGQRLSGGEKQRISIARCLLKNPDLIIFDEPTVHLDSVAVRNLLSSIQILFREKTCIIISHHLNNIQWADRILVLEKGRLIQEGKHSDLIKKTGEYKELFDANP